MDDRITQYGDLARSHEDEIRPDFVMMLGLVYIESRNHPGEMVHCWVLGAMRRHDIPADAFTDANPFRGNIVLPESDRAQ